MLALDPQQIQFRNRRRAMGEQPLLEAGIAPGAGDDPGAVVGTHTSLEGLDPGIDGSRVHEPQLDQKALERLDPQRGIGGHLSDDVFRAVRVVMRHLTYLSIEAAPRIWGAIVCSFMRRKEWFCHPRSHQADNSAFQPSMIGDISCSVKRGNSSRM
jgi:hypothetical protein